MHHALFAVHTDMRLQTEVPLLSFPGLVHLRVALPGRVLRRAGCVDNCRVHYGSRCDADALAVQMMVYRIQPDLCRDSLGQTALVAFEVALTESMNERRLLRRKASHARAPYTQLKRQRVSSFNMDSDPAHRLRKESLGSLCCPIRSELETENHAQLRT
jgi:hypothetical protein